ncbi:MAG TPA: ribose-phosphate pyrophosphokinase [Nitrospiraceae bacterium]|jgi:ribose-phosphate pyrophosphokinase|nr:ribose-phosphate pyrophosphokinase [Nitrospiraceae bacterium]
MSREFVVLAGTANPELAAAVAADLGLLPGACAIERFPDGEISVQLQESVRRKEVFLIQPLSPPVNDHLVELLALADACRRAAAARITAVVPYLGYARSDKRHRRREPITGRMVADVLETVGIDHLVTVDLHAPQIEGFFRIPVDTLTAVPRLATFLREELPQGVVVVAPDVGALRMATDYAHRLNGTVAVLHKRRDSATGTHVTHLVGDVGGKTCLIVDDMISTGGTIASAIEALLKAGARQELTIAATHGLLLAGARQKLAQDAVKTIAITDTVFQPIRDWPQLQSISIAPVIAGALKRFLEHRSLSDLYRGD